jgi:hypothetical protein
MKVCEKIECMRHQIPGSEKEVAFVVNYLNNPLPKTRQSPDPSLLGQKPGVPGLAFPERLK